MTHARTLKTLLNVEDPAAVFNHFPAKLVMLALATHMLLDKAHAQPANDTIIPNPHHDAEAISLGIFATSAIVLTPLLAICFLYCCLRKLHHHHHNPYHEIHEHVPCTTAQVQSSYTTFPSSADPCTMQTPYVDERGCVVESSSESECEQEEHDCSPVSFPR